MHAEYVDRVSMSGESKYVAVDPTVCAWSAYICKCLHWHPLPSEFL